VLRILYFSTMNSRKLIIIQSKKLVRKNEKLVRESHGKVGEFQNFELVTTTWVYVHLRVAKLL